MDPSLGPGYDYDVFNTEVLLTRASVKNGLIVLPDGMSYRLLVLPERKDMPADVAAKIAGLVKAGATVVGTPPERDPGLKNYPDCDKKLQKIATAVWGTEKEGKPEGRTYGKGRVFQGTPLRKILLADTILPDFDWAGNANLDFIHRRDGAAETYFLVNRGGAAKVDCQFRVSGRAPELWNPVDGTMRPLPEFSEKDGRTVVPMCFEAGQSFFVVFGISKTLSVTLSGQGSGANFHELKPVQELTGSWTVQFDEKWFYPVISQQVQSSVVFETLTDWTLRPEEAIKYYSGTATYRKTFNFPQVSSFKFPVSNLFLDLGVVKEMAAVRLNGKDLGTVWCAPWRVDISKAIQAGDNQLEIKVVNLWPNRLIGDAALPAKKKDGRGPI